MQHHSLKQYAHGSRQIHRSGAHISPPSTGKTDLFHLAFAEENYLIGNFSYQVCNVLNFFAMDEYHFT